MAAQLEVFRVQIDQLEEKHNGLCDRMKTIEKDLEKIMEQMAAVKYILIGAILVESPQAIQAIKTLFLAG